MSKKPKTPNALMKYLRNNKGIKIDGSTQKRKLRNMGYFHGYKGYRFCASPNNLLPINNFNELQAIYNFDMSLKSGMYSQVMFIETALKNYVLEAVMEDSGSVFFNDVFGKVLTDYKSFGVGTKDYTNAVKTRLNLRNKIYAEISKNYEGGFIVKHYYDKDAPVPVWAIFELLTLGEFGTFYKCLCLSTRLKISHAIGINQSRNSDGKIILSIIFLLKDLRNAIAHNNIVFDARFKNSIISKRLMKFVEAETGVSDITFNTIVDYVIIMTYMLKCFKAPKSEILSFVRKFEVACESLRSQVPASIYNKIMYTDTKKKLKQIKHFL